MVKRIARGILGFATMLAMFAESPGAQAQSSTGQLSELTNPGFEEPRVKEASFELVETLPGWTTTDTHFEIWSSGFKEVKAWEGTQFAELNAYNHSTLYQDSTGIQAGSVLEFTFAHRGRSGEDTMRLTITDLGADNALEGGDDTVLFTHDYTTGMDEWKVYTSTTEEPIKALGNTVRFAYGAISTASGDLKEGNFLDAANFGIGVVTQKHGVASVNIIFTDDGTDTTATISGSLDTTGFGEPTHRYSGKTPVYRVIGPDIGWFGIVSDDSLGTLIWDNINMTRSTGEAGGAFGYGTGKTKPIHSASQSGDMFQFFAAGSKLQLPPNYASGAPISGQVVYPGVTVADLGVVNTDYTLADGQIIRIQLNETPPADAMKLDIDSGPFTFGYSTTEEPGFHQFTETDYPFPKDPNIKRLNRKKGDWFSFVQNIGDTASDPTKTATVHYPAKDEGSGVLHPGPKPGDVAMARFTAESDGEYHFNITSTVIAEKPTGVGVTISVGNEAGGEVVDKKHMTEHNVPWIKSFSRTLKRGDTVDIAVDNGEGESWTLDHVLVTPVWWTTP